MYICSVLLYRCYLSVYSPFLLIVDAHSVVCFDACVWGGWTKAMCLVPALSHESFTNHVNTHIHTHIHTKTKNGQSKMYKMCLVSNRPATSSSTLGIIIPKVTGQSQLSCSLGLWQSAQAVRRVRCAFWYKKNNLTRHRLNLWHLSARTASFTTLLNIRNDCLQSMCTVKKQFFYLYTVFCASLFLLLCWTSPLESL